MHTTHVADEGDAALRIEVADVMRGVPWRVRHIERAARDIDRVAQICALTADGLNLAGIRRVLALQEETRQLQAELARLRELTSARLASAERSRKQRPGQADGG